MSLTKLLHSPLAAGVLLIITSFIAIILCNTGGEELYTSFIHRSIAGVPVEKFVNDVLMSVFFLMVGLEIKREFLTGQLAQWSQRMLPGAAAVGGMLVPAAIYLVINREDHHTLSGWAIPSATDIAFSLGILSLLGSKVPTSLKIFLAALAIIDDLGAVIIIALFYTAGINIDMLSGALVTVIVLLLLNRRGVVALPVYLSLGVVLWYFINQSGIHATVAGVILALCIPHSGQKIGQTSPLLKLEHRLAPWVSFLIIPVFGFVNAGVSFLHTSVDQLFSAVPLGIMLGLFIGKQLGIGLISFLLIRFGVAQLPKGATTLQFYGVAMLCGIGFTMSLFIGGLAFPNDPMLLDEVKIGVLGGSLLSAVVGVVLLNVAYRRKEIA
ncbi:sodium/proton antiporter, NhaA family [Rosenbergiella nectarea]|uniref:Na(+)/H(+) antiporter NhaA n=1 Tax=Rosenbergiella nectarea TaxID=988801 RepID=A0A1H9IE31_9GAMM|nr:Na+/H+ antiporter NhaA [Rosenbergiella nectarea]SEQ72836.1 sodium/proton antiporter, NhaA family [Rosenbergiella nectarea]